MFGSRNPLCQVQTVGSRNLAGQWFHEFGNCRGYDGARLVEPVSTGQDPHRTWLGGHGHQCLGHRLFSRLALLTYKITLLAMEFLSHATEILNRPGSLGN